MDQAAQPQIPLPPLPQLPPMSPSDTRAMGEMAQAVSAVPPPAASSTSATIGVPKEQLAQTSTPPERTPLVELRESERIPEEVEGWMEKLEQAGEIKIPEAIKKDEQVILDNTVPTRVRDVVVLPLTQQGAVVAAKKSVTESARWLYEWCMRLAKMLEDRAKYRV